MESELKGFDIQVRKLLNMYQMFSINSDVDRLYTSRKSGGRGLIAVWDAFRSNICRVAHVLSNSENEILSACQPVDEKSLFSNIKRAKKFENEVQIDLPLNFREKGVLLQAKIGLMEDEAATWCFFQKIRVGGWD